MAVITFHASPVVMGVLAAMQFAAYPFVGLLAGVVADRWSRRATMLIADVVRAAALASVPLAAAWHLLGIAWLVAVAACIGAASAFFDVAYQALVPALARPEELERANARLEFTNSAAQIGGKGLAGWLIAAIGVLSVMILDAASFVFSALTIAAIRVREPHRERLVREPFFASLRGGFAVVFGSSALRTIVAATTLSNFASAVVGAVYLIFAYRDLHVSPQVLGVILAVANLGFAGALAAPRIVQAIGLGATLTVSMAVAAASYAILPLALFAPLPVLLASQFGLTLAVPVYNVAQVSARQRLAPANALGRMTATVRTIGMGVMPIGALLGGALADRFGIVQTLAASACVVLCAVPLLLLPAVRSFGAVPPARTAG